jgi:hypothetical protein
MRKILYILPLLFLIVLSYRVHSQYPVWPIWFGDKPMFTTQLVYQFNVTDSYASVNPQFIQFTVPEQVLQQQLYYCKTYDPYITSIDLSQCAFAYPGVVVVYSNSSNISIGYEIPLFTLVLSYDNVTGLPQTFAILVQHHIGTLSPGTYYLYVYYPSPFFLSFESVRDFSYVPECPSNPMNATSSNFNGGWCARIPGPLSADNLYTCAFPGYLVPYCLSQTVTDYLHFAFPVFAGYLQRYLYVKFNPAYPVFIGSPIYSCSMDGCTYTLTVTLRNPSTGQTVSLKSPVSLVVPNILIELRNLELQNGIDPNQYNEIVSVTIDISNPSGRGWVIFGGVYLQYVPET